MAPNPSVPKPNFQECYKVLQEMMEYVPKLNIMDENDPEYKEMCVKCNVGVAKLLENMPKSPEKASDVKNDKDNTEEILKCINENKFDKLLEFGEFDLEKMYNNDLYKEQSFVKLFDLKDNKIMKHFIDNVVDLESIDSTNWKIIHYICKFSTPEMIKYIIDRGVYLDCYTNDDWKPIDLICRYSTSKMIKYIIDRARLIDIREMKFNDTIDEKERQKLIKEINMEYFFY